MICPCVQAQVSTTISYAITTQKYDVQGVSVIASLRKIVCSCLRLCS